MAVKQIPSKIVIATRESRLALWQAEHVQARLSALYPDTQVELLKMTTRGDQILDKTLSKVGGKGLFVKELETALLDGRADLAVHSLKDVPVDLQSPFQLACVMEREDPRDAFVSPNYASLADLPAGAIVGTSSLRREAQIRERYPHLEVKPLRGNLDTRLRKLDEGQYAAIILAAAGLKRLGLANRIRAYLSIDDSLPAAGQGALGIEILESRTDMFALLQPLVDSTTQSCVAAERAVSFVLGGSCQVPLAAHATLQDNMLAIRALVASTDGKQILRAELSGPVSQAKELGVEVAQQLKAKGGQALVEQALAQAKAS
ncbi:hydroxymethylbilane synthase [Pelistega europaea]|uniref:Porphobilinogen deaminase n=1 Tax=Pelistega europaea TaxID=106147 RepID=A0A7Y4P5B7_9BURK|nr:hydroxymethylbilane synthase [Pelistega europaea]NOL49633.1 hydroxymethylbilane synthase [Pelistega europaea]